ncbi:MAG: trigger factor [Cryomorphaceae bacterium]|nr:trigger factor [Cryomorphaceae bacterium]
MKVTQRQVDELHDIISIEVENADYQDKVEEKLRDYRKKANIPGFRPGKVPMGLIRKQYEKPLLFDEVNNLLSREVTRYIDEQKLNIIAQPVPVANDNINWDSHETKVFEFEIGLEPTINLDLEKLKGITRAEIELDEKTIDEEVENFTRRYGSMQDKETADREDFLHGIYFEVTEKGEDLPEEERLEKSGSLPLRSLTDKAAKNWTGKKAGEQGIINLDKDIKKDFNVASVTGFNEEEIEECRHFSFEIEKISQLVPAELNQELFDKIFGEGKITSEEELRNHLKGQLEAEFANQSQQYLFNQVYKSLMALEVKMPETFLKNWLKSSSEKGMSDEEAAEQYADMYPAIKWQFIRDHILREHEVVIDEASILHAMKQRLAKQFQIPEGMGDMDQVLEGIAKQALEKEDERNRIVDDLMIGHLISIFDEKVKAKSKKMSWDDFLNLANDA